jgi:hypothetical protein
MRSVLPLLCIAACTLHAGTQSKIAIGDVVYNYVGCVYIDPQTGSGEVAGYFISFAGIEGSPFSGTPSEATAYFTFRSEPLTFSEFTAGDLTAIVLNEGKWHVYYNPAPAGKWSDPTSFSQGQVVVDFNHNALEQVTVGQVTTSVFSGDLLESFPFVYGGKPINLGDYVPNGIVNFGTQSTTSFTQAQTLQFPIVLPFAGSAIAKGGSHRQ